MHLGSSGYPIGEQDCYSNSGTTIHKFFNKAKCVVSLLKPKALFRGTSESFHQRRLFWCTLRLPGQLPFVQPTLWDGYWRRLADGILRAGWVWRVHIPHLSFRQTPCASFLKCGFVLNETGFSGFVWCVLFWFLAHSHPASHPRITADEREYLLLAANSGESEHRYPEFRVDIQYCMGADSECEVPIRYHQDFRWCYVIVVSSGISIKNKSKPCLRKRRPRRLKISRAKTKTWVNPLSINLNPLYSYLSNWQFVNMTLSIRNSSKNWYQFSGQNSDQQKVYWIATQSTEWMYGWPRRIQHRENLLLNFILV